MHEERMIGPGTDHADLYAMLRIPTRERVDHVEPRPRIEIVDRALPIDLERGVIHCNVHSAPPDVFLRCGMLNDALIAGRTSCFLAGIRNEGAAGGDCRTFLVPN